MALRLNRLVASGDPIVCDPAQKVPFESKWIKTPLNRGSWAVFSLAQSLQLLGQPIMRKERESRGFIGLSARLNFSFWRTDGAGCRGLKAALKFRG